LPDHPDERARGIRSVAADLIDENAVKPRSGEDRSNDAYVAAM